MYNTEFVVNLRLASHFTAYIINKITPIMQWQ